MKWMVNGIVVDDAELRRLNLPIAGDCITKQCGNDKTKGDGKFLPPPTYKGLYEETVQRLNKVWEESHKSNVKHLEIMTKLLKDMEEKKTKKMTKAEAFEWLKNKKVYVGGNSAVIQEKLFEAGFEWVENKRNISNIEQPFLILSEGGGIFYSNNMCHYLERSHEEISSDDILSIEIVEEKQCSEEDALDLISTVGARLSEVLRRMEGHKHIVITEDDIILYDEGMSLFHSDPF